MRRPVILDLFSGGGGAAMGYYRAGFDVVGVDIKAQPHYPSFHDAEYASHFEFHQADAMTYPLEGFDAIHASPPCQGYSIMNNLPWNREREYPYLILPLRERLTTWGKPFVIENVAGARYGAKGLTKRGLEAHGMKAGWLCGAMFGLPFYRHRLFETNWFWLQPGHPKHQARIRSGSPLAGRARDIVFSEPKGNFDRWRASGDPIAALMGKMATLGKWQNGAAANGVGIGHAVGWRKAAEVMGIDWMKRDELTQAIPPVYTHWLGKQLMKELLR